MITLKSVKEHGLVYDHIVGTGGIGSGLVFNLKGNESLSRNESREATLLPYKDYCKQHIILHYLAVLLGSTKPGGFKCYPIGRVGADDAGTGLLNMMKDTGMDISNVNISKQHATLFSVCYQYPDHSGGNITNADSACSEVTAKDISSFFRDTTLNGKTGIILAVPEVPVDARVELLKNGKLTGSLNFASVLSSEINEFKKLGGFTLTDVLAVNLDEAKNIAGLNNGIDATGLIIEKCIQHLTRINSSMMVLITCGSSGVYCYAGNHLELCVALKVPVISTAGAGDAFLAGFIAGMCCGLPVFKGRNDSYFSETPLASANELGVLLASLSVTSGDTIHTGAGAEMLLNFIKQNNLTPGAEFIKIFSGVKKV